MKQTTQKTPLMEAVIAFPAPPAHLSPRSQELWRVLAPTAAKPLQRRTLFQTALESLDRADQARALIESEGLVSKTKSTGALHVHPAVKIERECRQQFAHIWGDSLRLGWDPTNMFGRT